MKLSKNRKKGIFVLSAIFQVIVGMVIATFAWDTARLIYSKVHNQNLSSAVAISITNESSHYLPDSTGKAHKGYLVAKKSTGGKRPKGFSGRFADDPLFAKEILDKNNPNQGHFKVIDYNVNNNYTDLKRFMTGSDGVNGEVKVTLTSNVQMFLSNINSLFGLPKGPTMKTIKNTSYSTPLFRSTGSEIIDWGQVESGPNGYIPVY